MSEVIHQNGKTCDEEVVVLLAVRRGLLREVARVEKRLKEIGVILNEKGGENE